MQSKNDHTLLFAAFENVAENIENVTKYIEIFGVEVLTSQSLAKPK